MSILIKGMKMPTDGELLCINIYPDGKVYINLDLECKQVATAVPIHPHGRFGDLDALAQQIEYERFHHPHTNGLAAQHHIAEYSHFLKVIADTPTIIEVEEGE